MNLEELTKTQIVLLVLLVSFVTSIATGIVTVSLLDQAPPAVTQTINRIVERTIERVVPDTAATPSAQRAGAAAVVTKETTVVVKDEDLITQAIEKNRKSVVRIQKVIANEAGEVKKETIALGVIVNAAGLVATDAAALARGSAYAALTSEGTSYILKAAYLAESPVALLSIQKDPNDKAKFIPVQFTDLSKLKLGQSIISFSGAERDDVQIGIIRSLLTVKVPPEKEGGEEATILAFIDTDLSGAILSGTPLFNIFGELVGLETSAARDISPRSFSPNRLVLDAVTFLSKQQ